MGDADRNWSRVMLNYVKNLISPETLTTYDGTKHPVVDSIANSQYRDVIGNKTDTAVTTASSVASIVGYLKGILGITNKIDGVAVLGLNGVVDSLAYKVHEIEKHFHNNEQLFGSNSGYMGIDYLTKFQLTGGDTVWGTELYLHTGDVIEGGSATKKFDLDTFYLLSVSAANKVSLIEFLISTRGAAITGTVVEATEVYTRVAGDPMLVNDDKVVVTNLTNITGLIATEVYYVTNVSGATFKLSRTIGGASATLGGTDGTFAINKLIQTSLTKKYISAASVTTDSAPILLKSTRQTCDKHISIRAKSASGSTITIGFLLGLHTYSA